ncbi:MAG TPA: dihydropteroate synthase [Acidimicrobiia bacterium]|nr:dihydropteroate synthase [Acidimicrobiia bacterium]
MFTWGDVCGARPAVMGVVNVTPDSFSDGGRWLDPGRAVAHGLDLVAQGADLLDVGGESTRPGAEPVSADEERRRVVPVIERLVVESGVPVSVDTTKAGVAAAALDDGATIVNDVSAARFDPAILEVTARAGAGYVAMHMLGEPRTMQDDPRYDDVVGDVGDFLVERLAAARAAGIAGAAVAADPGIGFGKTVRHNLELLARLGELVARVDAPVVVGTSRKRFIGAVLGRDGQDLPADDREEGTLATHVCALDRGARIVRVHAARPAAQAVELLDAMRSAGAAA